MTTGPTPAVERLHRALVQHGADARSDADLLADFVRTRDAATAEAIVRRHGPMVWGVCRRLLDHHHDAEDAFQATFLVLARRPDAVRPPGLLGNWLYGVARRTALKARGLASKRRAREATVAELPDPPAPEPTGWADLRPILDRELDRLPAKYRAPIVLCDLEGKTRQEAARRLGWPEGTVNSRLSLGRKKLAARLARRGLALSGGVLTVTLVEQATARVPPELVAATVSQLIAKSPAAATPAAVLAERVVKAMSTSKLKLAAVVMAVAGLIGGGVFLLPASGDAPPDRPPAVSVTADDKPLILKGHTDSAFAVAFSPDGQRIASGSFDKTIKIWDAAEGKELLTLKGHTLPVVSVVYEPDGRHVISAASEFYGENAFRGAGEVKRWDAATGREVRAFPMGLPTFAVTVSPDGKRLAVAGGTNEHSELTMWDLLTGKELFASTAKVIWPFMSADFSADGTTLAVAGGREVIVYEAATGKALFRTAEHPDPVYAAVFSPDGTWLASAGIGKPPGIRAWDPRTGKRLPTIETDQRSIKSLAFSKDGKVLASASLMGTAAVFDTASGKELLRLKDFNCNVNAVAFDKDTTRLAVATADKLVRVYAVKVGDPAAAPKPKADPKPAPKDEKNARQVAIAFFEAAVAGKVVDAQALGDPAKNWANKVKDFEKAGLKAVNVSVAFADDKEALIISEPVELAKEGKGHVLLYLRRKDDKWLARDIDFEPSEKALRKQRDFLEAHLNAKPVK